jgi:hypothetical protein
MASTLSSMMGNTKKIGIGARNRDLMVAVGCFFVFFLILNFFFQS